MSETKDDLPPAALTEDLVNAAIYYEQVNGEFSKPAREKLFAARAAIETRIAWSNACVVRANEERFAESKRCDRLSERLGRVLETVRVLILVSECLQQTSKSEIGRAEISAARAIWNEFSGQPALSRTSGE